MPSYNLNLCDMQIAFRTEADPARVERARAYVDERYSRIKTQGGQAGRDKLLVMLLFSMADDLLELREKSSWADTRLDELLQCLKENEQPEKGEPMLAPSAEMA